MFDEDRTKSITGDVLDKIVRNEWIKNSDINFVPDHLVFNCLKLLWGDDYPSVREVWNVCKYALCTRFFLSSKIRCKECFKFIA